MSDLDFLRIVKSSSKSGLTPANTQGQASSSMNLSCLIFSGVLPSPGASFNNMLPLDHKRVSYDPGFMGRSFLISSHSPISLRNSSMFSKRSLHVALTDVSFLRISSSSGIVSGKSLSLRFTMKYTVSVKPTELFHSSDKTTFVAYRAQR